MTPRGKPFILKNRRKAGISQPKDVPCKRCYRRCVLVGKVWECPRHGPRLDGPE